MDSGVIFDELEVPGESGRALVASPAGGARGEVIVLPGIHGRTPHILGLAQRLGLHGYRAVIADFYCTAAQRGELRTPQDLGAATAALDQPAIVQSLVGLLHSERDALPVGVLGYCVGGAIALQAAAQTDNVAALVVYYAVVRPDRDDAAEPAPLRAAGALHCPVLAHYGTTDVWAPLEDVDALEGKLAASSAPYQVYRYPGAGHAFEENGRPGFRPVAANEAAARTMTFFDHYLGHT
jgi:carboxymethylenebutenolidase